MTKKTSIKKQLIASIVAIALCFTSLIGTTFAWFTDSVTSSGNVIKTGKLDVELYYAEGTEDPAKANWNNANGVAVYKAAQLWEPGYTDAKHFKIANEGTLALKYQLAIIPTGEVSELAEVIQVYLYEIADTDANATQIADRDDVDEGMYVGTLAEVIKRGIKQGSLEAGCDYTTTIVLKMDKDAGNEYQEKSIGDDFKIQLLATQYTAEGDSFNDQYDKDAWMAGMKVYTASDLQAAINAGEPSIKLMDDITLDETIVIPATATTFSMRSVTPATVIDLNGKTITGNVGRDADGNRVHVIVNNGNAVIKNGIVKSAGDNGGSAIYNAAGATLTIEDVTVYGAPMVAPAWPSYGINNYGNMTVNGATVKSYHGAISTGGDGVTVINDATVDVGQGTETNQTSWALYSFDNGQVTVNGGTFANTKEEKGEVYGGGYICAISSKSFIVNGGTFIKTEGDGNGTGFYYQNKNLIINGGTFDAAPSAYVADGFKAIEKDGLYYVVTDGIDNVIVTPQHLVALGGTKINGTYMLMADLDMTGKVMKPMEVSGGASVNFIGNGHTISNLTLNAAGIHGMTGAGNEVAGLFDLSAPATTVSLTVSDLAFENATVACSGYAAVIAGYNPNGGTVITLNNVDVAGATVTSDSVAALVGYTTGSLVMTDCDVSGLTLTGEAGRPEKVGAFVGTANTADCAVTVTDCTNNTGYKVAGRVINGATWNGNIVATTAGTLQDALNAATGDTTIILLADITGDVIVSQKEGVNITIDGNDYKYDGTINVHGNSRNTGAEKLTIKNVNFVTTGEVTRDFVQSYRNNTLTEQRYAHNVTIEGCTFTNEYGGTVVAACFRQAYNITIKDCEVNGLFSVLWATGGECLTIDNVDGQCADEGIHIGTSDPVVVNGCDLKVEGENGYGVRADATGAYTLTVTDCTFDAAKAIVLRNAVAAYKATVDGVPFVATSQGLQAAIADGETEIILADGDFIANLYDISARDTLIITGQGADTKLAFSNLQVRASQFKNLTISNCTIERMPNKSWGHLVFGSSTTPGGVYTISNCTFNGVGSQGIYINQTVAATFNIENCTFNGDFGGEGAITIQDNDVAGLTVNVTGCSFNNIPETSHEIAVLFTSTSAWTLNAEGVTVWYRDK